MTDDAELIAAFIRERGVTTCPPPRQKREVKFTKCRRDSLAERDAYIREHYATMTDAEIADVWDCTIPAIASARVKYGLVRGGSVGAKAKVGTPTNPTGWSLPRGMTKEEKRWALANWWTDQEAKLALVHERDRIRRQG